MSFAFIAQAAQSSGGGLIGFIPFLVIIVVVYFLMLRPQMKKQKEHAAMLNALGRGDDVVTNGGIHGRIVGLNDKDGTFQMQIAKGIIVNVERGAVARRKSVGPSEPAESKPNEPREQREPRENREPRQRRPENAPANREAGGNQPVSAMVVTGTRTAQERPSSNGGGEGGSKKGRYRRSRRRNKSGFQQGQGQGQPAEAAGSTPEPARQEPQAPEQPLGESQHVGE